MMGMPMMNMQQMMQGWIQSNTVQQKTLSSAAFPFVLYTHNIYIYIINIIYIYIYTYRDLATENLENPKNLHNNIIHLGTSTSSTIPSQSLPGGQMAGASAAASLSCNALVFVYFHLGPLAIPKPSNSSRNPT